MAELVNGYEVVITKRGGSGQYYYEGHILDVPDMLLSWDVYGHFTPGKKSSFDLILRTVNDNK